VPTVFTVDDVMGLAARGRLVAAARIPVVGTGVVGLRG
jgi:hypothetical protein